MVKKALKVGSRAPVFTLRDQNGRKVSLKDRKGHWSVVYFYAKDETPSCTKEACEFRSELGRFRRLDADVMGINPDTPESHKRFARNHRLKLHLLSDPEHKTMEKYGAWGTRNAGRRRTRGPIRSTVLIDPNGRIAHYWPRVRPKGHARAVRQKLTELQAS